MTGRVVVITGADNGIGLNMVKGLLAMQFRVSALDLEIEHLSALQPGYPDSLMVIACDVTDETTVKSAVDATVAEWGRIDILVNNACLALFGNFEGKSLLNTRREFEVNYFGCLHMIRAVLPIMKLAGRGVIHNVSSGVGITGFPGIYGYASTKGAIESLTRTLAIELAGFGITVNLMHPPLTNTRSSAPLGIPQEAMAAPEQVGRLLAKKIGSRKSVITPDLKTGFGLFFSRHLPGAMGRMLAWLTKKSRKGEGES